MRYLLDTNAFLFWTSNDKKLSPKARTAMASAKNELVLSAASSWEIAIKYNLGKLRLPEEPARYVTSRLRQHQIDTMPVEHHEALQVARLPAIHDDPFDRLLIAQALHRKLRVITADTRFAEYGVEVVW